MIGWEGLVLTVFESIFTPVGSLSAQKLSCCSGFLSSDVFSKTIEVKP